MQNEEKITIPTPVELKKTQKSDNNNPDQATIVNSTLQFEHVQRTGSKTDPRKNNYRGGGFGLVKMVFDLAKDAKKPAYAVKIMNKKEAAENEIKYNVFLGRDSFWGTMNNKFYVFMPWINGVTLEDYCRQLKAHVVEGKPMTYPFFTISQRITMFLEYLAQAKLLHDQGLILGDPKTSNCMIDFETSSLKLTDLDAIHSKGAHGWGRTTVMLPPNVIKSSGISQKYSQKDDIFIFGIMLAEMLPEFFAVTIFKKEDKLSPEFKFIYKGPYNKKINNLNELITLMTSSPLERPNINHCIETLTKIKFEEQAKSEIKQETSIQPKNSDEKELEDFKNAYHELSIILEESDILEEFKSQELINSTETQHNDDKENKQQQASQNSEPKKENSIENKLFRIFKTRHPNFGKNTAAESKVTPVNEHKESTSP